MQRRELFTVLVKAMGLWELVAGLQGLPIYIYNYPDRFAALSGMQFLTGCALFFAAGWMGRMVYPDSAKHQSPMKRKCANPKCNAGCHCWGRKACKRPLKNAVAAFSSLAKCRAKPHTARKITTYVAILRSQPCDQAVC